MKMLVESTHRRFGVFKPRIRAALNAALAFLGKKQAYLEVFLVSDTEIRRLNRRFRGKDKPTNVLSFGFAPGFPGPENRRLVLGEIFLAPDYARRKKEPLARLLVHGLLHLLGYAHGVLRDKIKMEALEDKIEAHLRKKKSYF